MRRAPLPFDFNDARQRYMTGDSLLQLSMRLGVSRSVLDRAFRARGVPMRTQSEAEAVKWQRMSQARRRRQVAAAHEARRGATNSDGHQQRIMARRSAQRGPDEDRLAQWIRERGIAVDQQVPVGRYLCDLTTSSVAVEVFGGNWHSGGRHGARARQRFAYIRDAGWHLYVVLVNARRAPLVAAVADDLVAYIQSLCSRPAISRQYRVIRGNAELVSIGAADRDYDAFVRAIGGQ